MPGLDFHAERVSAAETGEAKARKRLEDAQRTLDDMISSFLPSEAPVSAAEAGKAEII